MLPSEEDDPASGAGPGAEGADGGVVGLIADANGVGSAMDSGMAVSASLAEPGGSNGNGEAGRFEAAEDGAAAGGASGAIESASGDLPEGPAAGGSPPLPGSPCAPKIRSSVQSSFPTAGASKEGAPITARVSSSSRRQPSHIAICCSAGSRSDAGSVPLTSASILGLTAAQSMNSVSECCGGILSDSRGWAVPWGKRNRRRSAHATPAANVDAERQLGASRGAPLLRRGRLRGRRCSSRSLPRPRRTSRSLLCSALHPS